MEPTKPHREQDASLTTDPPAFGSAVLDELLEGCVIVDRDWRVRYVNREAVRQARRPREQLLDHTLQELYPDIERSPVMEALRQVLSDQTPRTLESTLVLPDGTLGSFELRIEPVYLGLFLLSREITERRVAEAALEETDARFRTLFDTMEQGVVFQDAGGRITQANAAAQRILGLTLDQLEGRTSRHPEWRAIREDGTDYPGEAHPSMVALRSGQVVRGVMGVWSPPAQGHRWIEITAVPLLRPGAPGPHQVYTLFTDVTERRRAEHQLRIAGRLEAVGRLAGGVAHDFNNLLSVILGNVEFALQGVVPEDPLHEDLDEIRRAGRRAAEITQQLLAFGRKQVLTPVRLDLGQVLASMEGLIRRAMGEDIEVTLLPGPGLWPVLADRGPLEQVIMSLAIHARDAMPGGGSLEIATANVELDAAQAATHEGLQPGPFVRLTLRDTGEAMDAETQARIFEPFVSTRELGRGSGLGLATVYGVVRQSGGGISVRSAPGVGTTFEVLLPRAAVAEDAPVTAPAPGAPTLRGDETVLVVEDDDGVRRLAHRFLAAAGYTVMTASGGGEALLACEQHTGPLHLLLTDVVMPRMNGRVLAERLRSARPGLRVLYMSGYTDQIILEKGLADPRTPFLPKPFTAESLTARVREVLDAPQ